VTDHIPVGTADLAAALADFRLTVRTRDYGLLDATVASPGEAAGELYARLWPSPGDGPEVVAGELRDPGPAVIASVDGLFAPLDRGTRRRVLAYFAWREDCTLYPDDDD